MRPTQTDKKLLDGLTKKQYICINFPFPFNSSSCNGMLRGCQIEFPILSVERRGKLTSSWLIIRFAVVMLLLGGSLHAQAPLNRTFDSNETKLPVLLGIPAKANISLAGKDLQLSLSSSQDEVTQRVTPREGSIWINYSSVVNPLSTNSIFVSLGLGNIPAEISIKLKIDPYQGNGSGELGAPTAPIILSTFPQPIIVNIGSCYTGQGEGQGHKLTYSWELASNYDPELLKLDELEIATDIIYTIVNN